MPLGAGFSLDFQATDNFGWHPLVEKIKNLGGQ